MCLYPKLIINRKYTPTKKNGGVVPECMDERMKYVPVGCGNCIECRNQKKREWQIRLHEELKNDPKGLFITLTFSEEELKKLCKVARSKNSNKVAKIAVRRFLERWRKKYKVSVKHWLITELGHNNTERIHLHGILWTEESKETIEKIWNYGNIWVGDYTNGRTINYIVKYVTKVDLDHKGYKSIILTSAGIGKGYMNRTDWQKNKYVPHGTNEAYRLPNGMKSALPIYYRNKIYSEEEREKLWIEKLDKEERYVMGEKIDISTREGEINYLNALEYYQRKNIELGFGDDGLEWKLKNYMVTNEKLQELTKKKQLKRC